ncbi:phosphorylase family protein [Geotalea toluenoxydans]
MNISTIGIIAAMPEEVNPLLKRIGIYQREKRESFELFRFGLDVKKIVLVQSGMGAKHATRATRFLIKTASPDIILNFGFAGAVTAGPRVGDLVLADQVFSYDGTRFRKEATPSAELVDRMHCLVRQQISAENNIYRSSFITTLEITGKSELAKALPENCPYPALEMESAAVASAAAETGIPFAAMRAISDAAEEELGFSLEEFTDSEMNIKMTKILVTVAKKPWIIPQLLRLARNSNAAGKSLAIGVEAFLRAM